MDDLNFELCGICLLRPVKAKKVRGALLGEITCSHPECIAEYEMIMRDYPEEETYYDLQPEREQGKGIRSLGS